MSCSFSRPPQPHPPIPTYPVILSWVDQLRSNVTKSGREPGSYFMFNTPETESPTENNCKSPTDCPADDLGRELAPWTAVSCYQVDTVGHVFLRMYAS